VRGASPTGTAGDNDEAETNVSMKDPATDAAVALEV
jgi:hypothetical protein